MSLIRRYLPIFALIAAGCLVASCKSEPPPPPLPPVSFTRYQPIYLDVANVDFIEEYKSPGQEPNIEHLLPVTPADAMRIWVKDRLKPAGADKSLQIIIKDASIIASGPEDDPVRRYEAKLDVELRIYGTDAMSEASIQVLAHQSITVPKSASPEERKRAYHRMIMDMMESANAELEQQIFKHFTRYIMYAQTP